MKREQRIQKPFFEIGPKLYLYGRAAVELAEAADRLSVQYGVDIIFSAQYTDCLLYTSCRTVTENV